MNDAIKALEDELKSVREQQGKLSRKIGEAKKQGDDPSALLQEIQQVSRELKQLQAAIKQQRSGRGESTGGASNTGEAATPSIPLRELPPKAVTPSNFEIVSLSSQADQQAWDSFVAGVPQASNYHLSQWKQIIETSFGHPAHYLMAMDESGQCCGVLPLVELNSRLFGHFLVSIPYVNYGGPLASSIDAEKALIDAANQYAASHAIQHVEYRDEYQRENMPCRTDKVSMILPLQASVESQRSVLTSKLRSQVKRACEQEGMEFRTGGAELLDAFYKVFSRNMRDLGTPVYSRHFFQTVMQHQAESAHVVCVFYKGEPVSAGILLRSGATMEIPWASTLRKANRLNANMYFYWHILGYAIEQGCGYFDFGRSSKDSGTYKFKKQWGSLEKPLYWHYWLSEQGELPQLNPDNRKYAIAIKVWQWLPLFVANLLGPLIVRNLP